MAFHQWKVFKALCVGSILFGLTATKATASLNDPLVKAACQYRDSVQAFERLVHRTRCLNRYDVRLVERFENAACDFHAASSARHDADRLLHRWEEVISLEERVARAIFASNQHADMPAFYAAWQQVLATSQQLRHQMQCVQTPNFGGHYGRVQVPPGYDYFPAQPQSSVQQENPYGLGGNGPAWGPRQSAIQPSFRLDSINYGPYPDSAPRVDIGEIVIGALLNRFLNR